MNEIESLRFTVTAADLRTRYTTIAKEHAARANVLEVALGKYKTAILKQVSPEPQSLVHNPDLEESFNALWSGGDVERMASYRAQGPEEFSRGTAMLRTINHEKQFLEEIAKARTHEKDALFLAAHIENGINYRLSEKELNVLGFISTPQVWSNKPAIHDAKDMKLVEGKV